LSGLQILGFYANLKPRVRPRAKPPMKGIWLRNGRSPLSCWWSSGWETGRKPKRRSIRFWREGMPISRSRMRMRPRMFTAKTRIPKMRAIRELNFRMEKPMKSPPATPRRRG